jgi:hypothetical protein
VNSEELFGRLPGLEEPWINKEIKFDHQEKRVDILIDFPRGSEFHVLSVEYHMESMTPRNAHGDT